MATKYVGDRCQAKKTSQTSLLHPTLFSIHGYFLYETVRYVVVNLHGLYVKKYSVSRSTFRFIAEIDVEVNRHLKL